MTAIITATKIIDIAKVIVIKVILAKIRPIIPPPY